MTRTPGPSQPLRAHWLARLARRIRHGQYVPVPERIAAALARRGLPPVTPREPKDRQR